MRPLLLSHADVSGGAGRACYRLHRALRAAGVDSEMLVRSRASDDWTVHASAGGAPGWLDALRPGIGRRLGRLQRTPDAALRSLGLLPSRWAARVGRSGADVVNVHWVGAETISIPDLGRMPRPVVLTLHDMWAFTGTEHYAPDGPEARWRTGYPRGSRVPGSAGLDLDRWTWRRKRRHWRPMQVVCPSAWLARCAGESALMRDWPVRVIPNPLDLETFKPLDAGFARAALGLPADGRPLLLFGAVGGPRDPRKGYPLLVAALERLAGELPGVELVVFGASAPREGGGGAPVPVHWMGAVRDDPTLALLYAAADAVVLPALQENLPQCATEAQACGRPVVAFAVGGMGDAVEDRRTGFLAQPGAPAALAAGVRWVLESDERRRQLGEQARRRASTLWSPARVAGQYLEVFGEAMGDRGAAPEPARPAAREPARR